MTQTRLKRNQLEISEPDKVVQDGGWVSEIQGYILAETLGYPLEAELEHNQFNGSLKPLWIGIGTGGVYERYNQSGPNEWGYSEVNQALFERYTKRGVMPFVSDSYLASGNCFAMMASSGTRTAWIDAAVTDCINLNWRGITIDIEDFGNWTTTFRDNFLAFCTELSAKLKARGKLTQVYIPPIWNTASNGESGSGDEWDSLNSSGLYNLTYAQCNAITDVNMWEIPLYDYEFDYGNERPEAPLRWIADVISFAKTQFTDTNKICIGISSQGHFGVNGYVGQDLGATHNWTYTEASVQAQFNTAQRDQESGELFWKPSTINYWIADSVTMDIRRKLIESLGIKTISVWYIGNQQYSNNSSITNLGEPYVKFVTDYPASGKFVNTTVLTGSSTYTAAGLTLSTGATASSSQRNLFTFMNDGTTYPLFKGQPKISLALYLNSAATITGQYYGGLGNITVNGSGHTFTGSHVGFKLVGNGTTTTLSATIANGTTETATVLCTLVQNDVILLRAITNVDNTVSFYYNKNFAGWSIATTIVATNSPINQSASPYIQQSVSNVATANTFSVITSNASVEY
jgi:hypothetical protein